MDYRSVFTIIVYVYTHARLLGCAIKDCKPCLRLPELIKACGPAWNWILPEDYIKIISGEINSATGFSLLAKFSWKLWCH